MWKCFINLFVVELSYSNINVICFNSLPLWLFFNPYQRTFIYSLLLEREEGIKKEREANISVREEHLLLASCMCLDQGPNLHPRYVPWLGINPAVFLLPDDAPTNRASPARIHCDSWHMSYKKGISLNSGCTFLFISVAFNSSNLRLAELWFSHYNDWSESRCHLSSWCFHFNKQLESIM